MSWKMLGLVAAAALAGCAGTPEATKVVNRSSAPVDVIFVVKGEPAPQQLRVGAGKTVTLGAGHPLAHYARVEFRGGDQNVVFRDGDDGWRNSHCRSDCAFIWFGTGRVGITA